MIENNEFLNAQYQLIQQNMEGISTERKELKTKSDSISQYLRLETLLGGKKPK
jgi:prefoldin subunit 5